VVTGCSSCHNGTTATGKNSGHILTTASCETCHKSTTTWSGAKADHSTFTSATNCASCHNGMAATGKPANHIPEAQLLGGSSMTCMACHTSKTSWTTMRMNHNSSLGNGAGWCKSCHATGTAYLGNMEKKALTHKAKSGTSPTDCSVSGCHKPLGSKGAAYSKWD
jgi:NAD-dependent SIR2 family protein deacetylase